MDYVVTGMHFHCCTMLCILFTVLYLTRYFHAISDQLSLVLQINSNKFERYSSVNQFITLSEDNILNFMTEENDISIARFEITDD